MPSPNEKYLCSALDRFKEMISNGECSKTDISYFCKLSQYELDRRGVSVDKKGWLTKKEVSKALRISTSTLDRFVRKGILQKGKKVIHQKELLWKSEEVEQLKYRMLLKLKD